MGDRDDIDPKRLIRESYRIDGISAQECRSIFMDWALSIPIDADHRAMIETLLGRYGAGQDDHPMTVVLRDGLAIPSQRGRRGGRSARHPRK